MVNFSKLRLASFVMLIAIGLLSGFTVDTVSAQQNSGTIVGKVTDAGTGAPLIGANVYLVGTRFGAATINEGDYSIIRVPAGTYTVETSYVGFKSDKREITVSANQELRLNIELDSDLLQLDEVMVVGYGTMRKEEVTGSMVSISPEKLEQVQTATFQDVIQGTPGIQVTSRDGTPGAAIQIRVRGIGSITAGNDPLYVVDGIPLYTDTQEMSRTDFTNFGRSANVLASLNPNDIESIVVLKDASSTAIYGSRGANGVVLITTKGGVSGNPIWAQDAKIEVKAQTGFSTFAFDQLAEGLNAAQYTELFYDAQFASGFTQSEADATYNRLFPGGADTKWLDEMTQVGETRQYDISATGGTEKLTYFVSGSYYDQSGVIKENFFDRWSSRLNLTAQLTDKLSVANNINIAYTTQRGITDGTAWEAPMYLAYLLPPTLPVFDNEGNYYGEHQHVSIMGGNNPVGQLYDNERQMQNLRVIDNVQATYQFSDNLSFRSAWSFDVLNMDEYIFENGMYGDGRNNGGWGNEARSDAVTWQGIQTVNYDNTFWENHSYDVVVGFEENHTIRDFVEAQAEGYAHKDLKMLISGALPVLAESNRSEYSFRSMFTRGNWNYDEKYFASASFRRDGSSRFGPDKRWGNFWSFGLGYTISKEEFMEAVPYVDYMKFRTSYGSIGNAAINNYEWAGLYGFLPAYMGLPGANPSQIANTILTWESQENMNIAVDFAMFDNRVSGTVEYYKKISSDLLLDRPVSRTTGFEDVLQNYGDMENDGIEFSLQTELFASRDFNLSANFSITTVNNEVTRLGEAYEEGTKKRAEGHDYQEYFLYEWAGVDPATGQGLWYQDDAKTVTGFDRASKVWTGKSAAPDMFGNFGLSGNWKRFTFSATANYQFGNYLYDGPGRFINGDMGLAPRSTTVWLFENRWQQPGDIALAPETKWGGNGVSNSSNSTRYLFKGDYIRLKTVRIGYDVPETYTDMMKVGSLEVYLAFHNYFTWVADDNLQFDPEQTTSGVYNTITPISKTVSFGLNFGF